MRRSAYSAPMNIAGGNCKRSAKEKARYFETSIASIEELHYQCVLAEELRYITREQLIEVDDMINRTGFLITKLRSALL